MMTRECAFLTNSPRHSLIFTASKRLLSSNDSPGSNFRIERPRVCLAKPSDKCASFELVCVVVLCVCHVCGAGYAKRRLKRFVGKGSPPGFQEHARRLKLAQPPVCLAASPVPGLLFEILGLVEILLCLRRLLLLQQFLRISPAWVRSIGFGVCLGHSMTRSPMCSTDESMPSLSSASKAAPSGSESASTAASWLQSIQRYMAVGRPKRLQPITARPLPHLPANCCYARQLRMP